MLLDSLRRRRMIEWKTEDSVPTYHTRYSRKIIDDRRSKSGDGEFRDAPGKGNHCFRIASSKRAARQSGEKENRFHRSWFFDNCNIRNLWAMLNCALYERAETMNPHCIYLKMERRNRKIFFSIFRKFSVVSRRTEPILFEVFNVIPERTPMLPKEILVFDSLGIMWRFCAWTVLGTTGTGRRKQYF